MVGEEKPECEELNDYPYLKRFCVEEHIPLRPFEDTSSRWNLHNIIQTTILPLKRFYLLTYMVCHLASTRTPESWAKPLIHG